MSPVAVYCLDKLPAIIRVACRPPFLTKASILFNLLFYGKTGWFITQENRPVSDWQCEVNEVI
jgi:hypothetical protein